MVKTKFNDWLESPMSDFLCYALDLVRTLYLIVISNHNFQFTTVNSKGLEFDDGDRIS